MTDNEAVEVYRQRYETFRHLDKLRWQMLQILVAIGTATTLILRSTSGPLAWWFFVLLGGALLVLAFAMHKINQGIRGNGKVLQKTGKVVGDDAIPDVSNPWRSVAHWLTIGTGTVGVVLLIYGVDVGHNLPLPLRGTP